MTEPSQDNNRGRTSTRTRSVVKPRRYQSSRQVIQWPDGIVTAFGPYKGSTHDSRAAEEILLDNLVDQHCSFPDRSFVLFGDKGYGLGQHIITPFPTRADQTREEAEWNRRMSSYRIGVEWGIGHIKSQWKFLTNKAILKPLLSPVSMYFFAACFFANLHTCINEGCQVSEYFAVPPPTLQQYLSQI